MPNTPNPDTHCTTCGEPLSIYGHCWQHDLPPMDPALDKAPAAPYCNGQCGICDCQAITKTTTVATPPNG